MTLAMCHPIWPASVLQPHIELALSFDKCFLCDRFSQIIFSAQDAGMVGSKWVHLPQLEAWPAG